MAKMGGSRVSFCLALALVAASSIETRAQDSTESGPVNIVPQPKKSDQPTVPQPKANIRSDVNVVLIPVTVTDPLNRFVTGLDQEVFDVFEDKVKQKIVSF